ncbi:sugar phosphate isomerase/epimerase family protein [Agromyces soli]|uniref:Sugar phosphate isomerase/epimerase n=1 Tax=Agromyces soli TaxID=659012 RepID=A0ABY4AVF6_9MICO|nr:sugar phosphate isomerase/epimerase family protein [Agromyces soli]UOE27161.1 sugar phosphate isomerase/epimerase [Agromyces soli]
MRARLGLANANIPTEFEGFTEEIVADWLALGVRALALHFLGRHEEVVERGAALRARLNERDIEVVQYSGVNANLVHPSEEVRALALDSVRRAIPAAQQLGARMILSGAGSTSPDHTEAFYGPAAANYTDETAERLVDGLRRIAPMIEDAGLQYAIECHQLTTMRSPAVVREILDAVDSPAVFANFDPVNLLDSSYAVLTSADRIPEMVRTIGPRYASTTHVKDAAVLNDLVCRTIEVPPGQGVIDAADIFRAAAEIPAEATMALIIEHLNPADFRGAVDYVLARAADVGVEWV